MTVRIQTNNTEVIIVAITLNNVLQTGLADVLLKISRVSDDYIYDFNDDTFKASGWTSATVAMTEIDSTDLPGQYKYSFDTSSISNATADDSYILTVTCASGDNDPLIGEIKLGQYVDDIDASISTRASETNATTNTSSIITQVDANETKIDTLQTGLTEVLGLVQSNIRITATNDDAGNMETGTMKIYPTKADADNDTNAIHTYAITATVDGNGYTTAYKCTKES